MTEYDTIKAARALLKAAPKNMVRQSTVDDYTSKIRRLKEQAKQTGTFQAVIDEALNTAKKSSWQAMRAALLHSTRASLESKLGEQDALQRANKALEMLGRPVDLAIWKDSVNQVQHSCLALQKVLDAKLPIEGRIDRHTKRQDMRRLPIDWREQIIARMPRYAPATLTAAVTGCRPAELVNGIDLTIRGGNLVARIKGSKVDVTAGKGQEWREISWPADHENSMIRDLANQTKAAGGSLVVTIASASNFSKSMSNAAARIWPRRKTSITPYCMRHQAAADMKAAGGLSSVEISAALGHLSDVTKSTYGHAGMGRAGGVSPASVLAARPVKISEPSKAAKRKTAAIKNQPSVVPTKP